MDILVKYLAEAEEDLTEFRRAREAYEAAGESRIGRERIKTLNRAEKQAERVKLLCNFLLRNDHADSPKS